jgi:signal transduction histidine kinase
MVHAQQLSQAGQLAAAVAHEIRNPLTGIKLLAEAALRGTAPRPLDLEDTQFVLRETNRLEQTVQHFLDFARLPPAKMATCDLRDVVRRAWEMVHVRAVQQNVEANLSLPMEPVIVSADAGQLTAVLVNLFFNALDAMKSAGRVDVEMVDGADGVDIRIRDTGPGIPPEIQGRLFQPFATSKPNGTGLGLFLANRVLSDHGGSIRPANLPAGGACFTIRLPHPDPTEAGSST